MLFDYILPLLAGLKDIYEETFFLYFVAMMYLKLHLLKGHSPEQTIFACKIRGIFSLSFYDIVFDGQLWQLLRS